MQIRSLTDNSLIKKKKKKKKIIIPKSQIKVEKKKTNSIIDLVKQLGRRIFILFYVVLVCFLSKTH